MKKIFYILLIAVTSALTVTSCTEEAINPIQTNNADSDTGGGGSDPKK